MGATALFTGISAGASLLTARSQASALRSQGAYERQTFETNSRLAAIQAEDAIRRGDKEATELKKNTKRLIGSQRAALAAQGLDLEADDALAIQQETAELGAQDALTLKNNAWREGWGFRVQAQDSASRGAFAEVTAKNTARNTLLTGGLNAARELAGGYYSYKKGLR